MKAVVFTQHGGPDVLQYTEVREPRINANEVLIKVRACALNHLDLWVRRGIPGVAFPLPHIPGSDIAGEVAKVGELVNHVHVGQRVLLAPGVSCGVCEHCAAGDDNLCRHYTLFGYMIDGGCAEYVKAPEANVIPIPGDLKFEEAAAVPLVFLTAWHMLVTRARLQPGELVLILAGGSGVGTAAIQIAKLMNARVIATVGSEAKAAKAKQLGADETILHSKDSIKDEVKRLTARRGVDVVVEHVGESTWPESVASLAVGGRLVTCGATTGYHANIDLRFLFSRQQSILGSYVGSKAELHRVVALIGQRKLHAVIDTTLPMKKCALGHAMLEKREQFGKIVLVP